ncbi:MAG: PASTA domain-containing protein [Candidatus Sumerlaeia bacterium]|nr:PASTA domain-containing protein [Candidatus Sumerlaeia bacterium]
MAAKDSTPPSQTFFGLLWRMVVAGSLVFALAAGGAYFGVERMIRAPEADAPDLLTLGLDEALREASARGFPVRIEAEEPTGLLASGRVLSQRPLPGERVKAGAVVYLTVAAPPALGGLARGGGASEGR